MKCISGTCLGLQIHYKTAVKTSHAVKQTVPLIQGRGRQRVQRFLRYSATAEEEEIPTSEEQTFYILVNWTIV